VVRYLIETEIGRGALGRVVRVRDGQTGQSLAGKLLHDSFRDDARAVARFSAEARLLAGLEHDNVVRVYGLTEVGGRELILMELVEGPSLQTVLAREGGLPEARIVAIARGIARGLQAAHHRGLVHRDLKPANVLLAPGDVAKLVDFGLARTTSLIGVDRTAFALVGTPDYMAPESVDPLAVDARSDLYALGCVLYEMAAGRPPHDGASPFAVLEAHRLAPLPELPAGLAPGLVALISALLAKSPADRPQSAAAVLDALDGLGRHGGALVQAAAATPDAQAICARCGAPLLTAVAVCFGCGQATAALDPGEFSLFVVGPGRVAEKLDASLRQTLVDWLFLHPQLGLSPQPLGQTLPRLPFLLVSDVSEETGHALADALAGMGIRAEIRPGGPLALPEMRSKAWKLSGRAAAIAACFSGGVLQSFWKLPALAMLVLGVGAVAGVFITGWRMATQPATRRLTPPRPLSPALARALKVVTDTVPTIRAARHRDTLRGVLARLLAVEKALGSGDHAVAEDAAELVLSATQASLHLDRLEEELARVDLRDPGPADRVRLHERDRLASRLLDTAARLDGLRARLALADARQRSHAAGQALGELRYQVEALEEIAKVARP
jgi:hypothetical protein